MISTRCRAAAPFALVLFAGVLSAQTVAPFPFFDGFESGNLEPYWTPTVVFGTGQAQVTTANGPFSGNFHMTVDGNSGANTNIWVDLAVDLAGESGVVLDFAVRDYGDEYDPNEDGIFISEDGVTFAKIFDLDDTAASATYQIHSIDLDKALSDVGMVYTTPFFIRFGWSDEFLIPTDGFGFDDITLCLLEYTNLGILQSNNPTASGEFGASVVSIADLDGDGVRELAVGHPKFSLARGRVEVFSGKDYSPLKALTQNKVSDQFGRAIASLGDLDGDGFDELLVGAPFNDDAAPNAGAVFVYSTKTGTRLAALTGAASGDEFGSAVAGVPDLDGDGLMELLVGAPKADGAAGSDSGRGYVFSSVDFSLLLTLEGPQEGALAGSVVDALGDMDGDGVTDLVLGAPEFDFLTALNDKVGAAFIYSGADGSLVRSLVGENQNSRFGSALAVTEDLTGDGLLDLAIGAPDHAGTRGSLRFYDGASGVLIKEVLGDSVGDRFGASVARAGDVDGSGTGDIAAGTENSSAPPKGYVRGYDLATLDESFSFEPLVTGLGFGDMVQGVGDMNGDGLDDVAIGSPGEGAVSTDKAGVLRVVSTVGAPTVSSVTGVHSTLAGDAVVHGTNLFGNLTAEVDGLSRPVTFVSPVEALISLPVDEPGGFHEILVATDLGDVTLAEGLPRYPALKAPTTLALGDSLFVDIDNGEPGAYALAFSGLKYATPAPFENFGWFYGLELNGVWFVSVGSFGVGSTALSLVLGGTSSAALVGTPIYLQAWTFQVDLGLAGFTNTVTTTIVP